MLTIARSCTLSTGVTYTDSGNGTGSLTGIPAAGTDGTYPLSFTASNGVGSNATRNFGLVVTPSASGVKGGGKILNKPSGGYRITFLGNPEQAIP